MGGRKLVGEAREVKATIAHFAAYAVEAAASEANTLIDRVTECVHKVIVVLSREDDTPSPPHKA